MLQWMMYFPRRQFHIVDGDKLAKNPLPELEKVERFLGVKHYSEKRISFDKSRGFYCVISKGGHKCLGESKGRKHPPVNDEVLSRLKDYFKPFNEYFFKLVDQTFDW